MSTDHKIQAEKSRVIILTREVLAWLLGDKGDDKAEHAEVVVRLGDEVVERAEVTFEEGDGTMGAFRITMRDIACLDKVNALEAENAQLKMKVEGERSQRQMQETRAKKAEDERGTVAAMSDEQPTNVIRLLPPVKGETATQDVDLVKESILSALESAKGMSEADEVRFLMVVGRKKSGEVFVTASRPMDEIQALGILQAAQSMVTRLMNGRG